MRNSMFKTLMALLAGVSFFLAAGVSLRAVANESTGEKIENKMDEAGKDMRKGSRKMKRKARNASGHGSVGKDMKDAGKDAGDEIKTGAKKLKQKVD